MSRNLQLVGLYGGALFLAAVLLFSLQPLVVKLALPHLGGSPAVWNVSQVFFQVLLLAGYLYAHLLARMRSVRGALAIHALLLLVAFISLPIGLAGDWQPPATGSPIPALLETLTISVGLPFFAVATTAPLLQSWFSRSGHGNASDPYFLYSASNLGGLLALLAYPFVLEPTLGLSRQGLTWAVGYAALVALIGLSALRSWPLQAPPSVVVAVEPAHGAVLWRVRLRWIALAFAPSSLLLGVTLHISTNIASAPFLWIPPLAIYLLTWVITFARRPALSHRSMLALQAPALAVLVVFFDVQNLGLASILHGSVFFITAMVCHGELARTRPAASRLTEFYLWISVGGVLGGAFTGLLAPAIFSSVVEYPLVLVMACALRPWPACGRPGMSWRDLTWPLALALLYLAARWILNSLQFASTELANVVVAVAVAGLLWVMHRHVPRFALSAALLLMVSIASIDRSTILVQERSFYGVHRVLSDDHDRYRLLTHGNTVHGAQRHEPSQALEPLAYYTREGPAGQVFSVLDELWPQARITVIGLGSGALSCLHSGGPGIRYLEIDPKVVRIARDDRYLTYLSRCGAEDTVVRGDGRRTLHAIADGSNDLLVLDAFSSDAIPGHLLTVTAMQLYLRKLSPSGVLLLHLSNRHLDLGPVVAAASAAAGMVSHMQVHQPESASDARRYHWASIWMLAARDAEQLQPFLGTGDWQRQDPQARPWTDDYSNVAGAIRWERFW